MKTLFLILNARMEKKVRKKIILYSPTTLLNAQVEDVNHNCSADGRPDTEIPTLLLPAFEP